MFRLETVEDFERVRKALGDPKSKPHQYRVKEFGYCTYCKEVTECYHYAGKEGSSVGCLRCNRGYYELMGDTVSHTYFTRFEIDRMPQNAQKLVFERHSREYQRKFLKEQLEACIKILKKEQRVLSGKIRQLAKLR